jgi:hypothetical protein
VKIELNPLGCIGVLGALLSLGLMPLVRRSHERQFPRTLSDTGMQLRSGRNILWTDFVRAHSSATYRRDRYLFTQYTFWHSGGRVTFPSHRIADAQAVIRYITARLPASVAIQEGSPTVLRW